MRTINPPGPIPDGPMLGYAATSRSAGAVRSGSRLVTPATIADRISPILTTVVVRSNGNAGGTGGTAREVFKAVRVRKTRCAMRPRPFSRISAGGRNSSGSRAQMSAARAVLVAFGHIQNRYPL
ncbi:MAG: hypothetical protein C7B43_12665 [Sulfobacillus benefaciens]|uniref:Uncharacterized protein n=1 Tax=Sulfobacillus benefaciens TaxID=453960 RepID=A0A2T2WXP6_9FIRM|nr:MAG: hypothetical protein C7B43_12665 [Sulfobacillus benefaciens]